MKVFKICTESENGIEIRFAGVPTAKEGKCLKSLFPPVDVTEESKELMHGYLKNCDLPMVQALINGGEY